MITDPARNRYLSGLGIGMIFGAIAAANTDKFPTLIVALGVIFGVVGVALSFWEKKND